MIVRAIALALFFISCGGSDAAETRPPLTLDGQLIQAGQRYDMTLSVPKGNDDPATFIPLTIINGNTPGPRVVIVAGVHGYEFAPILAMDPLIRSIDPKQARGALIIVRVAHIGAYESRSPYVNPFDRKNLNRSFPGARNGTQTERIAHALSTRVIAGADFVFDVHSGDGGEWLQPFVGVYGGPLATNYKQALAVAEATGFDTIVRYSMNTQAQIDAGRSLNRQAVAAGAATILMETGENGRRDDQDVERIVNGLRNALGVLGVLPTQRAQNRTSPRYFDGTQSVRAAHAGLWTPVHRRGRLVEKGEVLGSIRDYSGMIVETVIAPVSGYAIYGLAGPPIRAGDSVMSIAKPVPGLD